MLQSSTKLKNSNHSNNDESLNQSGFLAGSKIDRMQLMKAYETILRSEGMLPVMDSKIYNLVFKVFQKCEKALQNETSNSIKQSQMSEDSNILQASLNQFKQKSEQMQKAAAYHEFRLQNKVFDAIHLILDNRISNDKENITQSSHHDDSKASFGGFGNSNKIYINEPHKVVLGTKHIDTNLPRSAGNQPTKESFAFKHFSFKEELDNSGSKKNMSNITESHTHISGTYDLQQNPMQSQSKNSLPPRDPKKQAPPSSSGIASFVNHLNNNSSSDLNSQSACMQINVNPSPSNESLAPKNQSNPLKNPSLYQTQQHDARQKRQSLQNENLIAQNYFHYPESTKHRPSATQHFIDPNQSSITQIPANSSGIMSQSFTYIPIRQPRNSFNKENLISDSSVSMFGGGGPTSFLKAEDDYVVLVRYLRKWQQGVAIIKRERQVQRVQQHHMQVASNYYDQSLRTKGLLSFIKYRIVREREREQLAQCHSNVDANIIKFYFKMFINKYRERLWIKSGNNIATLFRSNVTLRRVLKEWQRYARLQKYRVNRVRKVFQKNIKPAQILLDIIGGFYTSQSRFNPIDIDIFQRVGYQYSRITERNKHLFNSMCVRVMTARIKKLFSNWKYYSQSIISFKNKRLSWIAKKCFRAIKSRVDIKKHIETKVEKILLHNKFRVIFALRKYSDRKIALKKQGRLAAKLHKQVACKQHFGKWQNIFRYYSTMMKESYAKDSLARVVFLKKYIREWSYYAQTHRYRRHALQLCAHNQYVRVLSDCFYTMHQHAKLQAKLRVKQQKVHSNHVRLVKQNFMVAWIRRSSLEYYARMVRDKALKYKLLIALRRNVAFKQILRQVEMVSCDHYQRRLLKITWNNLNSKRTRCLQLKNIRQIIHRQICQKLLANSMQGLQANRDMSQYQRECRINATHYYQRKLAQKVLYNMHVVAVKQRVLSNAYNYISHKRHLKAKHQVVATMMNKMSVNVGLRMRYQSFVTAKANHVTRKVFYTLYNSYYDSTAKLNYFTHKKIIHREAQIFYHWFEYTNKRLSFKETVHSLVQKKKNNLVQKTYGQLLINAHQNKMITHLNKIAAFVFFQSFLKKHLYAFKRYADYRRKLRVNFFIITQNRVRKIFQAYRRKISLKRQLAIHMENKMDSLVYKVFINWYQQIQKSKSLSSKFKYYQHKRESQMHRMVFTQLHLLAHIGDNLMQHAYKRIVTKKRNQSLTQSVALWKDFTKKFQKLSDSHAYIHSKLSSSILADHFQSWRNKAYYSNFEKVQLIPYLEVKKQRLLQKYINLLKHNVNNSERKLKLINDAACYYLNKTLSKCFNGILENAVRSQRKSQVTLISESHNGERIVKNAWIMMYNYCVSRQRLNLGYQHIADNHASLIRERFLNNWINNWNKKQLINEGTRRLQHFSKQSLIQQTMKGFKYNTIQSQSKRNFDETMKPFKQQLAQIMKSQVKHRYFKQWVDKFILSKRQQNQEIFEKQMEHATQFHNLILKKHVFITIKNQKQNNLRITLNFSKVEKIVYKIQKKVVLNQLQLNHLNFQLAVKFESDNHLHIKRAVLQQLKIFKNLRLLMNKAKIQAAAFNRLLLLLRGLKSMHCYSQRQQVLKKKYGKISKVYRDQLIQKGIMVLQWNRMRSLYYGSLYVKSMNHYSCKTKAKCYAHFKKLLICKLIQYQIMQKHKFKQLSHYWNLLTTFYLNN